MVFVPGLILLAVELFFCKEVPVPALIVGKTLGIYVMYATILGGFYFYTLFIHHNLIVDILLMALAVALGQIISYNVVSKLNVSRAAEWIPLVMLIFLGAALRCSHLYRRVGSLSETQSLGDTEPISV